MERQIPFLWESPDDIPIEAGDPVIQDYENWKYPFMQNVKRV